MCNFYIIIKIIQLYPLKIKGTKRKIAFWGYEEFSGGKGDGLGKQSPCFWLLFSQKSNKNIKRLKRIKNIKKELEKN